MFNVLVNEKQIHLITTINKMKQDFYVRRKNTGVKQRKAKKIKKHPAR